MKKSYWLSQLVATRCTSKKNPNATAWQLVEPLGFHSVLHGVIWAEVGFITDLASVPRAPFAYWLFGGRADAPAVIHDWLCENDYMLCRISWRGAAEVFLEAMQASNIPPWQAYPMYWAVRLWKKRRQCELNQKPERGPL